MTTAVNDPLLTPFQLRDLRLRNRVVSTSHEPAYSVDGLPTERYTAYHVEKAKGGVALTMIGGSAVVAPDSPAAFGNLELYRDEIVPWLATLVDAVHEEGAAVICQITHLGRRTSNYSGEWLPLVAPSPGKERAHRAVPKVAEAWDIRRIVAAYAEGAKRCKDSGLDGIEIEAYGHLFDGFLSPATNHRSDAWGGSFEQRLRFPIEVLRAIRGAVGDDLLIGLRLAVTDLLAGGLSVEQGIEATRRLADEGVDFLSVIRGHIDTDEGLAQVIPPMGTPLAPHLKFAGEVRAQVGIPVMHASRIADVATARHAVSSGLLDLVGMTRAQIADPHLVAKLAAGEEQRIRPCVGAGMCLDAIYQGSDAKCIHNPSTGRELSLPHDVPRRTGPERHVVVVGAGPAGLEAARVLGERGHHVCVLEAAGQAGGQLRLAARSSARQELGGIIDWRLAECERLGVEVRYRTLADAKTVGAERADVVIVATGGSPDVSWLTTGSELVVEGWELLAGAAKPKASVLLYDDNGGHAGLDVAHALLRGGANVEYVTPERTLAPDLGGINYPPYARALAHAQTRITLLHTLEAVETHPEGLVATLYSEHADERFERVVDQVVVEAGTAPNDELYHELVAGSVNGGEVDYGALLELRPQQVRSNHDGQYELYRVGDAVSSRNVHAAIYDSFRLCLAI